VVDAARALGFAVLREQALPELDLRQLVLRTPEGMSTADALARLRASDPQLQVDFNHLYLRSGDAAGVRADAPSPERTALRRVGLIDSGVDRQHRALRGARVNAWGCNAESLPSPHGTAVASLLVGHDAAFAGVLPDSTLFAADVYCDRPTGGAVEDVVQALAWMARERVAVVNISLVGPANRTLESAVQALMRKGHLIIAAVGNDGPAAPPLYPAAYAGVVGVTGVMPSRRVLPEAAQGAQVMFAAPGAELAAARSGGGYVSARGTSYAAPVVAGLLAEMLSSPEPAAAASALARLTQSAQDLGAPGRDPVFGVGLVGEAARIALERVQAQLR
jgi:subtilisin family serine protease